MQLYLDYDGVLADFDRGASALLGMPPRIYEKRKRLGTFWRELARHPHFYGSLPLMPDAMLLFQAVRHLNPIILTGVPRGQWATPQKIRWAGEHFPGTRIITVLAVKKRKHARIATYWSTTSSTTLIYGKVRAAYSSIIMMR